ncbi:MAG: hypothetical protein L0207_00985 [Chlamydiae bacterium]|nr:hypothetical protein [Chlamydiota bacterium]
MATTATINSTFLFYLVREDNPEQNERILKLFQSLNFYCSENGEKEAAKFKEKYKSTITISPELPDIQVTELPIKYRKITDEPTRLPSKSDETFSGPPEIYNSFMQALIVISQREKDQQVAVVITHAKIIQIVVSTLLLKSAQDVEVTNGAIAVVKLKDYSAPTIEECFGIKLKNNNNEISFLPGIPPGLIWPQDNQDANEIEKYYEGLIKLAQQVLQNPNDNLSKLIPIYLSPSSSFIHRLFLELYEKGKLDLPSYDFNQLFFNGNSYEKERKNLLVFWIKKILSDYEKGVENSLPALLKIIKAKNYFFQSSSIDVPSSIDNATKCLNILKDIATCGNKEAAHILSSYYDWNFWCEGKLNLSPEERLAGLKELAEIGSEDAQRSLGQIYGLGSEWITLSKEARKAGMEWLISLEEKYNTFNYYVTRIYLDSGIRDILQYKLTAEEQLEILQQRAEKGDIHSLSAVLEIYNKGFLEDLNYRSSSSHQFPLNLTMEERFAKIRELEKINKKITNEFLVYCVMNFQGYIKLNMYTDEKLGWLLNQVDQGNVNAAIMLVPVLEKNQFFHLESINISLDERLKYLHKLAAKGNANAYETISNFYLNIDSSIADSKASTMSDQEKSKNLIDVTISGRHWENVKEKLLPTLPESQKATMSLIFSLLETLKSCSKTEEEWKGFR